MGRPLFTIRYSSMPVSLRVNGKGSPPTIALREFCVKRNITAGQHNIILSELSEGKTANPCSKFFQMERLCQIIVCTCIQTVNLIRHFTTGRQNQHLCVTVGFLLSVLKTVMPSASGKFKSSTTRSKLSSASICIAVIPS